MDEGYNEEILPISPLQSCGQSMEQQSCDQSRVHLESTTPVGSSQTLPTDESEGLKLGTKTRLKSAVWNHYKRQKIDDKWKAICNYCQKKLGGDTKNGTKHLHDHFASCPLRKTRDIRQSILKHKVDNEGKASIGTYTFDEDVARKELASMIIVHEYPLSMVEHEYFRRFVGAIQPLFKKISRHTVRRDIFKIYEQEKEKTMKLLENNGSKVAITTDMWTSSNQKKGFMAITTHFIDANWSLQSRIIRFIYVPCPHTADVLCDVLTNCLMDWNLDHKLSALTLDNCSTNDSMMNLILSKLSSNTVWIDGKLMHVRCCAHILNLIVKDGLDIIYETIEKVRDSVAFWSATPKRNEKFEETARQLKISCTKKLILDCKTRWNSTYLMLDVAICYKDVFKRLKQREPLYKCLPLDEEWEMATQICGKLKIFHDITETFSGTKYPTVNLFFPKICEIKMELMHWVNCGQPCIQLMASKMEEKFDKYWARVHGILCVATILDPRYKIKFLEYYFPLFYGDEMAKMEVAKVRDLCYDLVAEYSSKFKIGEHGVSTGGSSTSNSTQVPLSHDGGSSCMRNFDLYVASSESEIGSVQTELDHYLEERLMPRKNDLDILCWWKLALKYPTLQLIARDILAIPVSTVASESAFSTSGRFISPHRSRLHPDTVEALMCAQNWILAPTKDYISTTRSQCYTMIDDIDVDEEVVDVNKDGSGTSYQMIFD